MCHFSTGFDPWLALGTLSWLLGFGCPANWRLPNVSSGITFTAFRVATEYLYYPALSVWFSQAVWYACIPRCDPALHNSYYTCGYIVHTCRLLYIGYGLMGLNDIPMKGGNRPQFSCVFIDPSGLVKDISVPFHLALRYVFMFISFMMTNYFSSVMLGLAELIISNDGNWFCNMHGSFVHCIPIYTSTNYIYHCYCFCLVPCGKSILHYSQSYNVKFVVLLCLCVLLCSFVCVCF